MTVQTNSQKMARAAHQRVSQRQLDDAYTSFAREFPTLTHSCGLAQAAAFAQAKKGRQKEYLEDLAAVLHAAGHPAITSADCLANTTRNDTVAAYLRLSRDALLAAVWLKRYVEAAGKV